MRMNWIFQSVTGGKEVVIIWILWSVTGGTVCDNELDIAERCRRERRW